MSSDYSFHERLFDRARYITTLIVVGIGLGVLLLLATGFSSTSSLP